VLQKRHGKNFPNLTVIANVLTFGYEQRANIKFCVKLDKTFYRNISDVICGRLMGTKHCEPLTKRQSSAWKSSEETKKFKKEKLKKENAPAEIKSENYVHHFLRFGWD